MKKGVKVRVGEVISDRMKNTVVVRIKRRVPHLLYGKTVTRVKKVKTFIQG